MSDFLHELIQSGQFAVEDGKVRMLGEYVLVIPTGVVVHLFGLAEKACGRKKAEAVFEELGRFQVEAAARRYIDRYNFKEMPKEKIQEFTMKILNTIGWGMVKVGDIDVTKKRAQVVVGKGAFPEKWLLMKKKSKGPMDFWLKGMLKEHFKLIFGCDVDVKETKCLAKGDSYCLFEISKV